MAKKKPQLRRRVVGGREATREEVRGIVKGAAAQRRRRAAAAETRRQAEQRRAFLEDAGPPEFVKASPREVRTAAKSLQKKAQARGQEMDFKTALILIKDADIKRNVNFQARQRREAGFFGNLF